MRHIWTFAFVVFLAGCGGGGGGGNGRAGRSLGDTCPANPSGKLDYATTWGTTPNSASQLILIKDAAGTIIRSDSLNRNGQATSNLPLVTLTAGVYELRVILYPQVNAGGTPTKELSALIDLCGTNGTVTIRTLASEQASRMSVDPPLVDMSQNQTKRFIALATGASGNPAFVPFGSQKWNVIGTIGEITPVGVFTASAGGTGKVRASVTGTALSSTSDVTVEKFIPKHGKWTVLVFLNAANDLQPAAELNVNQMEAVAGNPDVRFVVQWKESSLAFQGSTFDGVRRYLVRGDSDRNKINSELVQDNLVDSQGNALDMGKPSTLLDFVKWGKQNYPADRYVLVIWNHGNGWKRSPWEEGTRGFSYDDQYGTHIDTWQIDQALAGETFDILAWDASLMQMMEVAYEARDRADFIVGSEESPPAEGYPYDAVFKAFRDNPDGATSLLAKGFVTGMLNNPPYVGRKITQSVFESAKLGAVASALNTLGQELSANKNAMAAIIAKVRTDSQSYSPNATRVYRDLIDVCKRLKAESGTPASVKTAATGVQNAVLAARVWEDHNVHSPGSNGLSVDFSSGSTFQSYRPDYIRLKLAKDTFWDEYLGAAP